MHNHEADHQTVCRGTVRQCLICGGRECDCGSDPAHRVFRCIHCGETEADEEPEGAPAPALQA